MRSAAECTSMALQRRTRIAVRVVGAVCLVAGLFPYYSRTSEPPSETGSSPIEIPVFGALPDRSSNTLFRLGLPFSPLFRFHREDRYEEKTSTTRAGEGAIRVKSEDGNLVDVKTVNFKSSSSFDWRLGFFSWSAAVAAVGAVLLVVSFLMPRG
jgi:hypothetical protein